MDGVLLIDKPSGPTSHDVVAAVRRASGEPRIGHTGTLDPLATGLLPLVLGRATKLASYLTGGDKTYEAVVRLGFPTDTDDAAGHPVGDPVAVAFTDEEIADALDAFRGTFEQKPPQHSAKKIAGRKAYELARKSQTVALASVTVTVRELACLERSKEYIRLRVTATSGFYVRALARDFGQRLGCGGHLASLRRTRSGALSLDNAVGFGEAIELGPAVRDRLVAPGDALPHLPAVIVAESGRQRIIHGNWLSPEHVVNQLLTRPDDDQPVRVFADDGRLLALARFDAGSLHPVVVLG